MVEKTDKPEKIEKAAKAEKPEKLDKADKAEKADKPPKLEKADKPEKAEKADKAEAAGKPAGKEAERKPGRKPRGKKREKKSIPIGKVFIQSTFNNTLVSFTDPKGNVIAWGSAGTAGFKGSRKGTPYAAQKAAQEASRRAMEHGVRQVEVYIRGPGGGREAAIRALQASGLMVTSIRDITPIPHNGCRPPKRRRV